MANKIPFLNNVNNVQGKGYGISYIPSCPNVDMHDPAFLDVHVSKTMTRGAMAYLRYYYYADDYSKEKIAREKLDIDAQIKVALKMGVRSDYARQTYELLDELETIRTDDTKRYQQTKRKLESLVPFIKSTEGKVFLEETGFSMNGTFRQEQAYYLLDINSILGKILGKEKNSQNFSFGEGEGAQMLKNWKYLTYDHSNYEHDIELRYKEELAEWKEKQRKSGKPSVNQEDEF